MKRPTSGPVRDDGTVVVPSEVSSWSPEEADQVLARLEAEVPVASGLTDISGQGAQEAIIFGDTHGDWRSTRAAVAPFLADPASKFLIGLGDYVDRPPDDCPNGSAANAFYLLSLVAAFPGHVYLLQGNHETVRRIPAFPEHLTAEIDELWGPDVTRYARLMGLLERGPVAALLARTTYLAHAAFPSGASGEGARARFNRPNDETLADVVWRECGASHLRRGVGEPFSERELTGFLDSLGARVMIRGHDPDLTGRSVFQDRCLTLHTSRIYERFGGVLIGRLPLDRPVATCRDVIVEHLETEGRVFPIPF